MKSVLRMNKYGLTLHLQR